MHAARPGTNYLDKDFTTWFTNKSVIRREEIDSFIAQMYAGAFAVTFHPGSSIYCVAKSGKKGRSGHRSSQQFRSNRLPRLNFRHRANFQEDAYSRQLTDSSGELCSLSRWLRSDLQQKRDTFEEWLTEAKRMPTIKILQRRCATFHIPYMTILVPAFICGRRRMSVRVSYLSVYQLEAKVLCPTTRFCERRSEGTVQGSIQPKRAGFRSESVLRWPP